MCGEHIQELYTVYLTRFRTYKIALPTQTKTQEGREPQTDKHLPPSPFTGHVLRKKPTYSIVMESISYFVHAYKDPLTPLRGLYTDLKNTKL